MRLPSKSTNWRPSIWATFHPPMSSPMRTRRISFCGPAWTMARASSASMTMPTNVTFGGAGGGGGGGGGLRSEQAVELADGGWERTGAVREWRIGDRADAPRAGSQDRRLAWLGHELERALEVEVELEFERGLA